MSAINAFKNANKRKHDRGWDTLYILLDIHGTVMKNNWDGIAHEFYPLAIETLQEISKDPTYKIIMWTCSKEEDRKVYKKLLEDRGINIYAVNENPDTEGTLDWGDYSQKLYCNVLLDDKAGFDPDKEWQEILDYLTYEERNKNMNRLELKNIETPTDLFVFGADFDSVPKLFSISDDYSYIGLKFKDSTSYLHTVGFVFVYTLEELRKVWSRLEEDSKYIFPEYYCIHIKNYSGKISLTSEEDIDLSDIDLKEYLQDQTNSDDWVDFLLELDCNKIEAKNLAYEEVNKMVENV